MASDSLAHVTMLCAEQFGVESASEDFEELVSPGSTPIIWRTGPIYG